MKKAHKQQQKKKTSKLRVAFLHPDLGIGGAERLVVDAGLALQSKLCDVTMFTSHHDRTHCFPETLGRLPVRVYGDWMPRHIFGKFHILFAVLRSLWLALALWVTCGSRGFDVLVVDQVSACVPLLRLLMRAKILFYCHFPDKLLSTRKSLFKRIYRLPFDLLEEFSTAMAHRVAVNSNFTAETFAREFPHIHSHPCVIYPSINCSKYDEVPPETTCPLPELPREATIFLSINRFERKKNVMLALEAFNLLLKEKIEWPNPLVLVIAGGHDPRVSENVEYLAELTKRAKELGILSQVIFVPNFTDVQRNYLLKQCVCLLYTPSHEHFGIVPIEAMYCRVPVVAVNNGGPLETVIDKETGFLCNSTPQDFARAMFTIAEDLKAAKAMGEAGRQMVIDRFSFASFADQLHSAVTSL
ncbi:alpha-1,3/1,6-mannosyltransferase ALG2 [Pelomyxa schiedti]|nr:alpha-1,3/1,6-mannosyltransferase ALG2 [Pelomyxa schiedti]